VDWGFVAGFVTGALAVPVVLAVWLVLKLWNWEKLR
jgi:hypothetical protein